MIYKYKDTIIAVCPGLGDDNWATCKLKKNGSWTTIKTSAMPRTDKIDEAIENLRKWAEKKGLRQIDCDCCYYQFGDFCTKYNESLKRLNVMFFTLAHLRYEECNEMERKCRICGCSFYNPCEGGCYWVEEDLCSKCAEKEGLIK